jgi:hypothetical protein
LEKRAAQTSYLTWNAVTATEKGENYFMPMGFAIYAHDMTIKK